MKINKHVPFRFFNSFVSFDTVLLTAIALYIRETETAGGIVI